MKFSVFFIIFFYLGSVSADFTCVDVLKKEVQPLRERIHYSHSIYATAVRKQCLGSCSIQSHINTLESVAHSRLAVNYNIVFSILEKARFLFRKPAEITETEVSYIDLMSGQTAEDAMMSINRQGVLLESEFKISKSLAKKNHEFLLLMKEKGILKEDIGSIPLKHLNITLGSLLKLIHEGEREHKRLFKEITREIKADLDALRPQARRNYIDFFGKRPEFVILEPERDEKYDFFQKLDNRVFDFWGTLKAGNRNKIKRDMAPADEFIKFIMKSIDDGKGVQLGFYFIEELISEKTGLAKLEIPLKNALDYAALGGYAMDDHGGHGVTLLDYGKDEKGKLYFLAKDSQGDHVYDQGYLHISAGYLAATALEAIVINPH